MRLLPDKQLALVLRSLSASQCRQLLDQLVDALAALAADADKPPAAAAAAARRFDQPLRCHLSTQHGDRTLLMPVSDSVHTGVKIVTAPAQLPESRAVNGIVGVVNVFDARNGRLLGLVGADEMTAFRTALVSMALWLRCCPAAMSRAHLVIFGAGKQAEWHARLALLLAGADVQSITFVNRSAARPLQLRAALQASYPGVRFDVLVADSSTSNTNYEDEKLQTVLAACDAIFSCTPATQPNFKYSSLKTGRQQQRFIALIGSYTPAMREVDTATLLSGGGTIYVDSSEACLAEAGELIRAQVGAHQLVEIGQVFRDSGAVVRPPPGANVVFKCVGMALMDLVVAKSLLDLAALQGVGMEVEF